MYKRLSGILILFSMVCMVQAEDQVLELKHLGDSQISYAGFTMEQDKKVHIKAIGAGADRELRRVYNSYDDKMNMFSYAWILDAQSRRMVWRMDIENTARNGKSKWTRIFDDDVFLKKGDYEVYFSAIYPRFPGLDGGFITFGEIVKRIFFGSDKARMNADEWMVSISGVDKIKERQTARKELNALKEKAIVDLTGIRDDEQETRGVTLREALEVEIYGLGEGFKKKMYDYGWIVDAQTRKKVWSMRVPESEDAGGAVKNRLFREKFKLEAGDYLFYYKSDNSHSYEEWNSNPPYDPFFWGMIVWPAGKGFNPESIKEYSEKKQRSLVSITRVEDYAYHEKRLKVNKPSKIRVFALGEGRDGRMFDYGWISDMANGDVVWKMKYQETEHAGGADKNRMYNGVIELDAGDYLVHYQTDDSHSYEDWNMKRPDEPEKWGITLYPVADKTHARLVEKKDMDEKNILARLVRVGDDERLRKQFKLQKRTTIRIFCLGEGDEDEMYDYGWLENMDTGERVWKMRYRNTRHAGGASKNRVEDRMLTLEPGTYRVHYRSDDSHSYRRWNQSPPRDERSWGITVYRLEE